LFFFLLLVLVLEGMPARTMLKHCFEHCSEHCPGHCVEHCSGQCVEHCFTHRNRAPVGRRHSNEHVPRERLGCSLSLATGVLPRDAVQVAGCATIRRRQRATFASRWATPSATPTSPRQLFFAAKLRRF
jgi:hypothetical protein